MALRRIQGLRHNLGHGNSSGMRGKDEETGRLKQSGRAVGLGQGTAQTGGERGHWGGGTRGCQKKWDGCPQRGRKARERQVWSSSVRQTSRVGINSCGEARG